MKKQAELFIVERENDGEWIDSYGNGGFSVYTERGEAQDALDNEADSGRESDHYRVVRFVRQDNPPQP
jgi:hypothetical protein